MTDHLTIDAMTLDVRSATVKAPTGRVGLTPCELRLMQHFLCHVEQLFSSERLAQDVFGCAPGLCDPANARFHVKNLRRKLEVTLAQPRVLHTVAAHGYMLRSAQ